MKKIRKVLALTLCAIALVGASVMGTMAYLTDNDTVTNTFTVGNVDITLDETDVDEYGVQDGETRVKTNKYKLLPGHEYTKDPTVTVVAGSEDAYVRMLVTVEGMTYLQNALSDAKYYADGVFLLQALCVDKEGNNTWDAENWHYKGYDEASNTYEFRYVGNDTENKGYFDIEQAVDDDATREGIQLPALFTTITVPGELNNAEIANLNEVKITVKAHAIQADGFANADEAWGKFDINAPAYDTPVTP